VWDIRGFRAISKAMKEDAQRARAELDAFQARVMAMGQPKFKDPRILGDVPSIAEQARAMGVSTRPRRPTLDIRGLNTEDDDARKKAGKTAKDNAKWFEDQRLKTIRDMIKEAEKSAKEMAEFNKVFTEARLADFQNQIKTSQAAIKNEESILEATRTADLISAKQYFDQKRSFVQKNADLQTRSLQAEIEALKSQTLAGKEAVQRDQKVADIQSQIARVRGETAATIQVLSIQEKASVDQLEKSWQDAKIAAQDYLETIQRQANRSISGIGKGNRQREFDAGLSAIEDKFREQEQQLARDNRNGKFADDPNRYQRELDLLRTTKEAETQIYLRHYQQVETARESFELGAAEGLRNYFDTATDTFSQIEGLVTRSFQSMENSLVDFVMTGKLDFKSLANSIIADMVRISVQRAILGPLAGALGMGSIFGGGRAHGGKVNPGKIYEVGEGDRSELFRSGGRTFLIPGNQGTIIPDVSVSGGGKTISLAPTYTINIDSRTDQSEVRMLVERAVRSGNARLIDQLEVAGKL